MNDYNSADYPRLRYDTAPDAKEKKAWKDFIKMHEPELYKEIQEREETK